MMKYSEQSASSEILYPEVVEKETVIQEKFSLAQLWEHVIKTKSFPGKNILL